MAPPVQTDTFAAVDLGSNSFHMVVARVVQEELRIVDRLRERVALAAGLDDKKRLSAQTEEHALECLGRFGERLRAMPPGSVRAVGTSTLRVARNARGFLTRAENVLGHPIEIVSGREEARLIYLGVAHDLADDANRRLVVDIGGGSSECCLGERFELLRADSLDMGCVNYSQRFFGRGAITKEALDSARLAARLEIQHLERSYRALGWEECVGSSGTILAIDEILRQNGWSEGGIEPKGLRKLRREIVEIGRIEDLLRLPGLSPDRATVFAGGVAILSALFDGLEIERMIVSQGALREGLIYDLLGRIRHEDVRDSTIRRFSERHQVDLEQASRVQRTALQVFARARTAWEIDREFGERFLVWAARLHEIGLSVAYSGHHHHGAYLAENSEMPGFSREDQHILAVLIEGQRRRFPSPRYEALAPRLQKDVLRLCLLLRLAVMMHRSRGRAVAPTFTLSARKSGYELDFVPGFLDENSLLRADLEQERARMADAGFEIAFR